VLAVYFIAGASDRSGLHGLLLTGIAVSALAGAMTSVMLVATEEFRVKTVLFWLAGGLEGRGWTHVQAGAAFVLSGAATLLLLARPLDVLSLGEEEAASLGLPVRATRLGLLGLASLVAGACTAVAGAVPFVGLMAPHALRPLVGPLSRRLLPAAFLGGALLVVLADLGARALSTRFELPLGALTAFVGAPYFLAALRANEGRG
jgi:iron complex transport system permease protein